MVRAELIMLIHTKAPVFDHKKGSELILINLGNLLHDFSTVLPLDCGKTKGYSSSSYADTRKRGEPYKWPVTRHL